MQTNPMHLNTIQSLASHEYTHKVLLDSRKRNEVKRHAVKIHIRIWQNASNARLMVCHQTIRSFLLGVGVGAGEMWVKPCMQQIPPQQQSLVERRLEWSSNVQVNGWGQTDMGIYPVKITRTNSWMCPPITAATMNAYETVYSYS